MFWRRIREPEKRYPVLYVYFHGSDAEAELYETRRSDVTEALAYGSPLVATAPDGATIIINSRHVLLVTDRPPKNGGE